jgi:uroporphyrinogen decarboxylase
MTSMTHRERVLAAVNHEPTDRIPIDFGGTYATTIYHASYERLKRLLGLEHETEIVSKTRPLAVPHSSVLERFDVDTRYLALGAYEGDQKDIDEDNYLDEWGTTWQKSGGGHYLYVDGPFFGIKHPDLALLENHAWIDPDNPGYYRGLAERAAALRRDTDCAIILNLPVGIVHQAQFLRGFADSLKDFYRHCDFAHRLYENLTDWWVRIADNALAAAAPNVDLMFFGDDLASQQGPLFDPVVYREFIKPHHRRMVGVAKAHGVKAVYHSCGAVSSLIEDLIDIGADALNPVQVSAKDMDPAHLKAAFGSRITFWGGINTQSVLPFGTPDEVRCEVRRIIDCLGRDGGYVLNSVHNIQDDVPTENIVAMFDEARCYVPRYA